MNPLRYAKALALSLALLAVPHAVRAQTPCEVKKTYDDAKARADAAQRALSDFQKQHKLPPGKMQGGRAALDAELARTRAEAITTDQVLKDAEKALTEAEQESASFASSADKGKRLADLGVLIKAHQAKIEAMRKELEGKKSQATQIADATKAGHEAEGAVKGKMPAIGLSDLDDAKTQLDDDVAQFEKAFQANQPPAPTWLQQLTGGAPVRAQGNNLPAVTTGLSCPQVTAVSGAMANKERMREKALDDYQNVDQSLPNAGALRNQFLLTIQESEKGIAEDLKALRTAVLDCQKEVQDGLKKVGAKRTELEQLDPGSALRTRQEELKALEADKSLETESKRLTAEQTTLKGLVTSAKTSITTSKEAKATADAAVGEVERTIRLNTEDETLKQVKPGYDPMVVNKDFEVRRADEDLSAAKTYLDDLKAITPQAQAFQRRKEAWKTAAAAWQARNAKTGKSPAETTWLQTERARLVTEKTALQQEKTRLTTLLTSRKISLKLQKICDRKKELLDALKNRKADLTPFNCFPDVTTKLGEIDTRGKLLAAVIAPPRANATGMFRLAAWTATPPRLHRSAGPTRSPPSLLESLECSIPDMELQSTLDELGEELTLEELTNTIDEPTDSVPADITKNTDQVKVPRYYVFLLTNASNGLYVGDEDGIKQSTRCGFVGGGIGCKPTDLITYKKLLGPFASQDEAQAALCKSITEARYFPAGIGMKGRWQGGNTWYGLWNASVSGCSR
jgi:hypothetical protein